MTEYKLYVGAQLIQRGETLSALTLLNDDKFRKASCYHSWWVINPDGSKTVLDEQGLCEEVHFDMIIPNGPDGKDVRFVIKHGMGAIVKG